MKKFFIALIGGTVVLLGIAMLVLPGPGIVAIGAGFAILATEFWWARRALRNAKGTLAKVRRRSGLGQWLRKARRVRACEAGERKKGTSSEAGSQSNAIAAPRL